jgi:hypothetical protein
MQGKSVVWGLSVETSADGQVVRVVGLPGINGALEARHGAYKFVTEDGAVHNGKSPSEQEWDTRTSLRYALLAYRNMLNAAISNAAWPRTRGQGNARKSRVEELARLQAETNAMLMALVKRFEQGNKEQGNK